MENISYITQNLLLTFELALVSDLTYSLALETSSDFPQKTQNLMKSPLEIKSCMSRPKIPVRVICPYHHWQSERRAVAKDHGISSRGLWDISLSVQLIFCFIALCPRPSRKKYMYHRRINSDRVFRFRRKKYQNQRCDLLLDIGGGLTV